MKFLSLLFLLFISLTASAQKPELARMRDNYFGAAKNEDALKAFMNGLDKRKKIDAIYIKAYRGLATMKMADYTTNPSGKMKNFNEGKALLEETIKEDSMNIELRFMRYTTQEDALPLMGYNDKLKTDKEFILKNYPSIKTKDKYLAKVIRTFMRESKHCDSKDLKVFAGEK